FLPTVPFAVSSALDKALKSCPVSPSAVEYFRKAYEKEARESRNPKSYVTLQFAHYINSKNMDGYAKSLFPKLKQMNNFSSHFKSAYINYLSALKAAETCATKNFNNPGSYAPFTLT